MGLFDKVMSSVNGAISTPYAGPQDMSLKPEWTQDRRIQLADPAPESLEELKAVCDIHDPGSVAAYWVYSVMCLTADYDIGMSMMKYLFADIEPFGRGFTEGGGVGRAGWDPYFNERLKDDDYRWLPRAYFDGSVASNGFHPVQPLAVKLYFNKPNTDTINGQTLKQLGRLNIVYYVQSNAAGFKNNIELSRFDGSDRFYVTKGTASTGLFYDQRAGLTAEARSKLWS